MVSQTVSEVMRGWLNYAQLWSGHQNTQEFV